MKPEPLPDRLPVLHGYCRVSTAGQATHGKSLEEQEAQITAFYHSRGADKFAQWGGVFRDAASAFKKEFRKRQAGGALVERLQAGDHIVITDLSRAFRSVPDFVNTIDRWNRLGVTLHILDYQISTNGKIGQMLLQMLAIFGQFQRDMIAERTSAVARYIRAAGKSARYDCEFGWKVSGPKGRRVLIPDEPARETIQLIAKLRDEGMTFEAIYFHLLEHRVFTNNLPHKGRVRADWKKGEWSQATIQDAYYYYKRNPEWRQIKREMVMARGGKPLGTDFAKRMYAPL